MVRIKRGNSARKKHKNTKIAAKGFVGAHSKLYRTARQQIVKGLSYSFSDRRKKKNQLRIIWITRINAAARRLKIKYSKLINFLKKIKITINKKMFSAVREKDKKSFYNLTITSKGGIIR